MTMEREHRQNSYAADGQAMDDTARDDAAATARPGPAFRYIEREEALKIAEQMMDRYKDVLRELAK